MKQLGSGFQGEIPNNISITMRDQKLLLASVILALLAAIAFNISYYYHLSTFDLIAGVFLLFSMFAAGFWALHEFSITFTEIQFARSESKASRLMREARHVDPDIVELILANPEAMDIRVVLGAEMGKPQTLLSIIGTEGTYIPLEFAIRFVKDSSETNTKPIREFNYGPDRELANAFVDTLVQLGWVYEFTGGNMSAGWRISKTDILYALEHPISHSEVQLEIG